MELILMWAGVALLIMAFSLSPAMETPHWTWWLYLSGIGLALGAVMIVVF